MCRRFRAFLGMCVVTASAMLLGFVVSQAEQPHPHNHSDAKRSPVTSRAPEELPRIPPPDAKVAQVPPGYRVEVVLAGLNYPSSIEFGAAGVMYVAEAGYIYGDDVASARILRVRTDGRTDIVADQLAGPVTDLLWYAGHLYISQRGKISVLESDGVRDLVTGLPSFGDHHNNQMTAGPDGKLYFGQGVATNSGVVGLDNFQMGWLAKHPDVHDVPAKDIRVTDQGFATPNPFAMLAEKREANTDHKGGHEEHQGHHAHDKGGAEKKSGAEQATPQSDPHHGHANSENAKTQKEPPRGKGREHHGESERDDEEHKGHRPEQKQAGDSQEKEDRAGMTTRTFGFQPFGKTPPDKGAIRGAIKANGTILRMNLDGSDLEVFAWGLRNPFGVLWGPDGELYASDNGYDERGGRPIAHAPDSLWRIKQGAWYGFPDYAGGIPVTDARFRPEHGPAPKFLMRDHPLVEKPLISLPHHVAAAKMDFSSSDRFGFTGRLFLALSGDMNPITGEHEERSGFEVVSVDLGSGKTETFFKAKKSAIGPKGMEYVVTAGPRRPVDVRFSKDGSSLYVADIGAMAVISTAAGPVPRPFPGTGVIWRITRIDDGARQGSRR